MKSSFIIAVLAIMICFACEEQVIVDLSDSEASLVIDAWLTNGENSQTVFISETTEFYDDLNRQQGVSGAVVIVENESMTEESYQFVEDVNNPGAYTWNPDAEQPTFGVVGNTYKLIVSLEDSEYVAYSTLNPVPEIDSIRFNYISGDNFTDPFYQAEFFAVEIQNRKDFYWVKGFINGQFLDQPRYITTSADGSISENINPQSDTSIFIPNIRTAINPFPASASDETAFGFSVGDSASVELQGITREAFLYLNEIKTQTDRPGGTSELFAVPMTNLNGNIQPSSTSHQKPLGFFLISSVSSLGVTLTEELAFELK